MAKQKSNKVKLGFRRRLGLYYDRLMLTIKLIILLAVMLLSFTTILDKQKQAAVNFFAIKLAGFRFVLDTVTIEGHHHINEEEIKQAIGVTKNTPVYLLNIDDIRRKIEENPWVKVALVERRLPNGLYIAISERIPIAIWQFNQKLYLIDEDGNRITSREIEKFSDLLHVVGQDANVYARNLIQDLEKHPSLAKRVVSAVRYGQRRWDLNFEQKITVKMPEKGFEDAYDYLNALNKKDKLFNQNYKTINLKDKDKYYVEKYDSKE